MAHELRGAAKGSSFTRLALRFRHLLNANTRRGSARNIIAHYDLGNDFFRVWLDEAMLYSSALWDGSTPTLEAAQSRKIELVLDLLDIRGGERILEIGCGWGALAVRLAEAGAAHVTGLTLSPAQFEFAHDLAAARGSASVTHRPRMRAHRTGRSSRRRCAQYPQYRADAPDQLDH